MQSRSGAAVDGPTQTEEALIAAAPHRKPRRSGRDQHLNRSAIPQDGAATRAASGRQWLPDMRDRDLVPPLRIRRMTETGWSWQEIAMAPTQDHGRDPSVILADMDAALVDQAHRLAAHRRLVTQLQQRTGNPPTVGPPAIHVLPPAAAGIGADPQDLARTCKIYDARQLPT
jgi:hypothetical protein